jgi:tRNA-specific 2-thiouridylase
MKNIAVLVSGGVDSSVVLRLLANEKQYKLTAFYLKIWLEDELQYLGNCPWEEDLSYVKACCEALNIPLEIVPLQREYNERVVNYTIAELKAGRTPSPDIFCNQRIKFGAFLDAVATPFDFVATGHYASTFEKDGKTWLKQGLDPVKDQTYFLSHLSQEQLQHCLFPLGDLQKSQVRQLAHEYDLPTKDRPDSQGICFLGKLKYKEFVKFHLGERPGDIVHLSSGKKLGQHTGYWFHTYGQRKGLRLHGGPWFVAEKDPEKNIVYVLHDSEAQQDAPRDFWVVNPNWLTAPIESASKLQVKLRHGPKKYNCSVAPDAENRLHVELDESDAGLANGQFAVFYDGLTCLGGGMIQLRPRQQDRQPLD